MMKAAYRRRPREGFSLVEIMIAVMILGIGLVMVAGAFPVGLRYFAASADETTAGLLARSVLSSLQAMRTRQYEAYEQRGGEWPRAEPYGQAAVVECFRTDTEDVVYLWDEAAHSGAAGRPGELLKDQGLGSDIDQWFPRAERLSGVDDRFYCQLFYKLMGDPLGNAPTRNATYQVFLVVQKTPEGMESEDFDVRFPGPSAARTLDEATRELAWPAGGVAPGAFLVEVGSGDWAKVVDVSGGTLTLNRSIGPGRVRAINHCVAMLRGVVSKEAIR